METELTIEEKAAILKMRFNVPVELIQFVLQEGYSDVLSERFLEDVNLAEQIAEITYAFTLDKVKTAVLKNREPNVTGPFIRRKVEEQNAETEQEPDSTT